MYTYKLRAECYIDIERFVKKLKAKFQVPKLTVEQFEYDGLTFPDHNMEFTTNATLDDMQKIFNKIVDSHVMSQTVNLADQYDGERYFNGKKVS